MCCGVLRNFNKCMSKAASLLWNNFMFYVIRNAEKINVLCLQTTDSYSSAEKLLLLIIYIVIVVQRQQHGARLYFISCYTNTDEKDDCDYFICPICSVASGNNDLSIKSRKRLGLIQTKKPNCTAKIICGKAKGNTTRKECAALASHLFTSNRGIGYSDLQKGH